MIINKFFIFCGLMFVLPIIYAAEFQIADTKIILPQKNITKSLKVPKGVELCGVSNIYQVLIHMKSKENNN